MLEDEDGRAYLFYCRAGENCIGVAELLCSLEEGQPRLSTMNGRIEFDTK